MAVRRGAGRVGALMIFYPHQLTDWAYVVIVAAYIVFYAKQGCGCGRFAEST